MQIREVMADPQNRRREVPAGAGDTESPSGTSVSEHIRQPFTLAGQITDWNLTTRELTILDGALVGRDLVVVSHLSTAGLEPGRRVVVAGYRDTIGARMVVTRLHLE
jgi:hypothetical protein